MLKKLTNTETPVRIPLLADEATQNAQFEKARELVAEDLANVDREEDDFFDTLLKLTRSTVGSGQQMEILRALESSARSLIDQKVRPKQLEKALGRLRNVMKDEDTREALAFVRAQISIQRYRETSDVSDLLNPNPEGASYVKLRAITPDVRRSAETRAGERPRLGGLLASRAFDVARKATRQGEDSSEAYARYVSLELNDTERAQLDEYDRFSLRMDCEIARAGLDEVEGFDLEPTDKGYPVEEFLKVCYEGVLVIQEVARHIRQVSTLGKKENSSELSTSGTDEFESEAGQFPTVGSVRTVSMEEDSRQ